MEKGRSARQPAGSAGSAAPAATPERAEGTRRKRPGLRSPTIPGTTVIVCTRDRPTLLLETVRSILSGDHHPAELLVVDQSKVEDAQLKALANKMPLIRYVRSNATGVSRSRNLAAREATHDVLAFIDDDVLVAPDWLAQITATLADEGAQVAVTGRVVLGEPESVGSFSTSANVRSERRRYRWPLREDVLKTGNMALHRPTLDRAGGFDETLGPGTRYPAAEDNELGYRLLRSGCAIVYDPQAVVVHRAWRPASARAGLRYGYGRGQGAFFATHAGSAAIGRRAAGTFAHRLLEVTRLLATDRTAARAEAAWLAGFVSGYFQRLLEHLTGSSGRHRDVT